MILKGAQAWDINFSQKPNSCGHKGLKHEIFKNRIQFGRDIEILKISE